MDNLNDQIRKVFIRELQETVRFPELVRELRFYKPMQLRDAVNETMGILRSLYMEGNERAYQVALMHDENSSGRYRVREWVTGIKSEVTITVSGMGGTIYYELQVILDALRKEGFTVEVQDEHPVDFSKSEDPPIEQIRKQALERNLRKRGIILKADHQPWGG